MILFKFKLQVSDILITEWIMCRNLPVFICSRQKKKKIKKIKNTVTDLFLNMIKLQL